MSFQTSVVDPAIGYEGQIAQAFGPRDIRSGLAEASATRAIVAGQPVMRGTADNQVRAVVNADTISAVTVAGFAVLDTTRPPGELGEGADSDGAPVAVMREGYLYLRVTADVSKGNPVCIGNATAQLGQIAGATGTGIVAYPGARFETSALSGGLALARIFPA
jgi:hypothetical protein